MVTKRGTRNIASILRFPDRHPEPSPARGWEEQQKICGGHGPGETPGPIPNPEAKAWHGDGTAPERMWESSTPPHSPSQGPPVEHHAPGGSFVYPRNTPGHHSSSTGSVWSTLIHPLLTRHIWDSEVSSGNENGHSSESAAFCCSVMFACHNASTTR